MEGEEARCFLEESELVTNATRLLARQFPSWVKLAQLRELRFTTPEE